MKAVEATIAAVGCRRAVRRTSSIRLGGEFPVLLAVPLAVAGIFHELPKCPEQKISTLAALISVLSIIAASAVQSCQRKRSRR